MMIPSWRLIVVAGLVLLPASALITLAPEFAPAAMFSSLGGLAFFLIDEFLGTRRLRLLMVEAPASVRLTQRRTAEVPIILLNSSPRPQIARVALAIPDGINCGELCQTIEIPPGKSAHNWRFTGMVRGDHYLSDLYLEIRSPLGLWYLRSSRRLTSELRVYPDLRDRATAAVFQRARQTGTRPHRQIGKGREFDRLRQFMPGDSYEDIYWKGTAKRGAPVVKLYHLEHSQRVYVALDCSRLSTMEDVLDGYVEAALHLALSAERQGDRFGVVVFSDRVHSIVQARHGAAHFRLCRDAIYNVKPRRVNPDFSDVFATLQSRITRRSLIVFLSCLDDAMLADTFERDVKVIARRHLVLVHLMKSALWKPLFDGPPPENLDAVYSRLAGQLHWNRIRQLQISLHSRGVRLSLLDPGQAKLQIAAAYMDVKRRQLL